MVRMVLDVGADWAVPVDAAIPLLPVSVAVARVSLASEPVEMAGVLRVEPVARTEAALPVKWLDRSEFMEEAALDRMLENPEETFSDTAESVAVAATLDRLELNEDAKLDKAADASLVTEAVGAAVAPLRASESTDDSAEETALEKSDAAEFTTPLAPVPDEAAEEAPED